ncbi:mediator of RNA polymerase II transcription subunit 23 isoform X1 [Daucus carota subsp. sativus]|uniref:mediator of RNA polymerase II transcription subunit 23 isoform X1 n=3 Tax=Daucus carota subsp. sativus TaxID=79200 RepID=UPI003082E6F6
MPIGLVYRNKLQKCVSANVVLPPCNEQFLVDFQQLLYQFSDQEQLRLMVESVLISLVIQCSNHAPRAEFLVYAIQRLCSIGYINFDTFLMSLLSSVTAAKSSICQGISNLHQLSCKIILNGLKFDLKPATHAEIFYHMLNWLEKWDQGQQERNESNSMRSWNPDRSAIVCLHSCLDVIWLLVEDDKGRVPFYELLRNCLPSIERLPDDMESFTIILEIHKRRDMLAMHMQMLDQHLHCPSFGTTRCIPQAMTNIATHQAKTTRYSPITYPSVFGEPLHGEELADIIGKGTLDWDRAMRCIRHAMRNTPSPDWWRRVLVLAPCYQKQPHAPAFGAVFTSEMICEAGLDRVAELLKLTNSVPDVDSWHEWLRFAELFHFLIRCGALDVYDFVDKLMARHADHQLVIKTNHVTWLLTQIQHENVLHASSTNPKKAETAASKMLSLHKEGTSSDHSSPESILLEYISSCQTLQLLSQYTALRGVINAEHIHKAEQQKIEWLRQASEGESMIDYLNMDDRSTGMFWALSYVSEPHACDTVISWLKLGGTELLSASHLQSSDRITMMREVVPVPVSLLSGLSLHMRVILASQLEETMFSGKVVASIALVETYARLFLIAPHSLFRTHFSHLTIRYPSMLREPGPSLLLLELLNYRFLSLYRYVGKNKTLMYDTTKIIACLKRKRGDHRTFRLAENLCINLLLSLKEFFAAKKDQEGPTDITETLNRITIMSLAIAIKTRGVTDADHLLHLPPMIEQILATSQHTWSEKTLRHFPSLLRNNLIGRTDKRGIAIQAWKQAEKTVINQCTQLLPPDADPSYVETYISHSFPQHRQYLCAGAWILMHDHPEDINSANLALVLREISPEEVTANIYNLVDVIFHHLQMELQRQQPLQELLKKTCANLAYLIFTHELVPLDILLLALIDRDDDPHALSIVVSLLESPVLQEKIKVYIDNCGGPEHWLFSGTFKRGELQKALGNHSSWKERFPPFFDDIAARLLPVIPLIIYRLIENEAMDAADRVLQLYSTFVQYYPLHFTFVRDILSYFYDYLPRKLILRILNVLNFKKIPFSKCLLLHVNASNAVTSPPLEYFTVLLLGIVNNVIPPLNNLIYGPGGDVRVPDNNIPMSSQAGPSFAFKGRKAFYQIPDPGTYAQLILETAVIEILSLPGPASYIISTLVQIVVYKPPTLIQTSNCLHGISPSNLLSQSGYTSQQLPCMLIQACGLLLAQLPQEFHAQLYTKAAQVIKDSWWFVDGAASTGFDVSYALQDPTQASNDNTCTPVGNVVSLLHSFFSNLPQEWLEGTNLIIEHLRPVKSIAVLRIVFRIMSPLLPRVANSRSLFTKMLLMLLNVLVDVFGKDSQPSSPVEAADIIDIIDFLHHIILYEGQGGPVEATSKPRAETLAMFEKMLEKLRPDVQHLLSHLKTDVNSSIYAATHPELVQNAM